MKNFLVSSATSILICILFIGLYIGLNSDKVGIIDSNRLLNEYKGTKLAMAEFEQRSKILQANLDTLTEEFQNELKKFEIERSTMTDKEMSLYQEILRNKQRQLKQYSEVTQKKIQEEDKSVTMRLLERVNQNIKEFGKENNYKFILGAKGDGGVLYGEEAIDITDQILDRLNNDL